MVNKAKLLRHKITWKCVIETSAGQKNKGKFNGMAPSRGYNSASGTLFIPHKTNRGHKTEAKKNHGSVIWSLVWCYKDKTAVLAQLEKTIVTKQHFSKKEYTVMCQFIDIDVVGHFNRTFRSVKIFVLANHLPKLALHKNLF